MQFLKLPNLLPGSYFCAKTLTSWPLQPDLEPEVSIQQSCVLAATEKPNYDIGLSGF